MKIGQQGIDLIKHYEQLRLTAYYDGGNVPTIGIGHTGFLNGQHLKITDKITEQQADILLLSDLVIVEKAVNQLVTVKLSQNQFDALVSFSFNVGSVNFKNSTLLHILNNGHYLAAAEEFKKWIKDNKGNIEAGLVKRRLSERILFEQNKLVYQ